MGGRDLKQEFPFVSSVRAWRRHVEVGTLSRMKLGCQHTSRRFVSSSIDSTLWQGEHSVSGGLGLSVQHSARVGVTVTTDTATLATFTGVVYQVSSVLLNVCDYQRVYASYKVITDNTDNMLWQDSASHHHLNLSVVRGRGVVTGQVCICIITPREAVLAMRNCEMSLFLVTSDLSQVLIIVPK